MWRSGDTIDAKMSFISSESFYQFYLKEFLCIICNKYMRPPIHQCKLQHNYCSNCYKRTQRCALCQNEHKSERNVLLEQFYNHVKFPCTFKEKGCTSIILGRKLLQHEENCSFNKKACPFASLNLCTWLGCKADIVQHFKDIHARGFYEGPCISHQIDKPSSENECSNFLIHSSNEWFNCQLKIKSSRYPSVCLMTIYCIENVEAISQFTFEVDLFAHVPNRYPILLDAQCGASANNTNKFTTIIPMSHKIDKLFGEGSVFNLQIRILPKCKKTDILRRSKLDAARKRGQLQ